MTSETQFGANTPTLDSVIAPAAVRWAAAGAELVVHMPSVVATHVLDPAAAVLWQCLDGISPLRVVFDDMADAYGVAPSVIAADCLPVIGSWLSAGIVAECSSAAAPAQTDGAGPNEPGPDEPAPAQDGDGVGGRTWRRLVDPPST